MNRQGDICGICEKPFPLFSSRFMHFIEHIMKGEAVGRFDKKGDWFFRKTRKAETQEGVSHEAV